MKCCKFCGEEITAGDYVSIPAHIVCALLVPQKQQSKGPYERSIIAHIPVCCACGLPDSKSPRRKLYRGNLAVACIKCETVKVKEPAACEAYVF